MVTKIFIDVCCNCFANGRFDFGSAPYQELMSQDPDGQYFYRDELIDARKDADQIYSDIYDWKESICDHNNPLFRSTVFELLGWIRHCKENWVSILSPTQFPNLTTFFWRNLQLDFLKRSVIEQTLGEIEQIKQGVFKVAMLLNERGDGQIMAVSEVDMMHYITSLGDYTSLLSHEGFSVVEASAFDLLRHGERGEDPLLAVRDYPVVFNANRFQLKKIEDRYHYLNLNTQAELIANVNLVDGYNKVQQGVFKVNYKEDYQIEDDFEVLSSLEEALRQALILDGWIESY